MTATVATRYEPAALRGFAALALERLGVPAAAAADVADCLVYADLRGVGSHGIVRLSVYARRLEAGVVTADPVMKLDPAGPAAAALDGANGLGIAVGGRAMDEACALAAASGVGLVSVRRSNHFGAAGWYVERAIRRRMIAIVCSNAPPNMAPWGGARRFLGTNPLAIGVPAGEEPPLVFDMATSVVARGKIILAAQRGDPIPEGWAVDPDGAPTTDAQAALAGAVLPFGGAKGSAISFIIDILSGVLSGAAYAEYLNTLEDLTAEQDLGHLFLAIPTDLFMPADAFARRMDDLLTMLKRQPPAPGVARVMAPGEPETATAAATEAAGIPLTPDVVEQLVTLGTRLGVALPTPKR